MIRTNQPPANPGRFTESQRIAIENRHRRLRHRLRAQPHPQHHHHRITPEPADERAIPASVGEGRCFLNHGLAHKVVVLQKSLI